MVSSGVIALVPVLHLGWYNGFKMCSELQWWKCEGRCEPGNLATSIPQNYIGTLVNWCIGAFVHWYIGALVHWYIGTLVDWHIGTLVHWTSYPCSTRLVQCTRCDPQVYPGKSCAPEFVFRQDNSSTAVTTSRSYNFSCKYSTQRG